MINCQSDFQLQLLTCLAYKHVKFGMLGGKQ